MLNKEQQILKDLMPTKNFFVGIDSDGSVFDTMEIKQKECFCPNYIKYWDLQPVAKYARQTWEFVNLYSQNRGVNRFIGLIESIKLLENRKEIKSRNFKTPNIKSIVNWTKNETNLSNPVLEKYNQKANSKTIKNALDWSKKVNSDVEEMVHGISPLPVVIDSLKLIQNKADSIVISGTPIEALQREWEEHKINDLVISIAGQEHGSKTEHINLAAKDKYENNKILIIGDSPGDLKSAKNNGVLFFPINPGHEEESWKLFYEEGFRKFLNMEYKGNYENKLIENFNNLLPELPSWN